MTVAELIMKLNEVTNQNLQVVISNVLNAPFAVYGIKEIKIGEEGPIYIRALRSDKE
jgi:hypothetical protein